MTDHHYIIVRGKPYIFFSLGDAKEAANLYYDLTGVIVGIFRLEGPA